MRKLPSLKHTHTHQFSTQNKCLVLEQSALLHPKKMLLIFFLSIMKIKIVETTTQKNEIKIKTRTESESESERLHNVVRKVSKMSNAREEMLIIARLELCY